MVQFRKDNPSRERKVRRVAANTDPKSYRIVSPSVTSSTSPEQNFIIFNSKKIVWSWNSDDAGEKWTPYPPQIARRLEVAYNQTGTCDDDIDISGKRYVNIPTMTQRVRDCPYIERRVKREVL